MFQFYGRLALFLREDELVPSDEDKSESADADMEALLAHQARVMVVVGPLLFVVGAGILATGIVFRLDRIAFVGPLAGWVGFLLAFAGVCTMAMLVLNRRDQRRIRRAEQNGD